MSTGWQAVPDDDGDDEELDDTDSPLRVTLSKESWKALDEAKRTGYKYISTYRPDHSPENANKAVSELVDKFLVAEFRQDTDEQFTFEGDVWIMEFPVVSFSGRLYVSRCEELEGEQALCVYDALADALAEEPGRAQGEAETPAAVPRVALRYGFYIPASAFAAHTQKLPQLTPGEFIEQYRRLLATKFDGAFDAQFWRGESGTEGMLFRKSSVIRPMPGQPVPSGVGSMLPSSLQYQRLLEAALLCSIVTSDQSPAWFVTPVLEDDDQ